MSTAVISDLHLGSRLRGDVLRDPRALERLLSALEGVDRLVLLGDTLELRDRPLADVLAVARPVLAAIGEVVRGGEVVLVPGNHDHRIAREAFGLRPGVRRRRPLALEEVARPAEGLPRAVATALGCETLVAYPAVRLFPDVWATHGHWADAHTSALGLELILGALSASARPGLRGDGPRSPDDYEAVLSPAYALFEGIAQVPRLQRAADAGKRLVRAAEVRAGARPASAGGGVAAPATAPLRRAAARLPGRREGAAPGEVRRPGVLPVRVLLDRLEVRAAAVLFGHTHRVGPVDGDPAEVWRTSAGTSLHNTGSWVQERGSGAPADPASPYAPGAVTYVGPAGVERVGRPLAGLGLAPPRDPG